MNQLISITLDNGKLTDVNRMSDAFTKSFLNYTKQKKRWEWVILPTPPSHLKKPISLPLTYIDNLIEWKIVWIQLQKLELKLKPLSILTRKNQSNMSKYFLIDKLLSKVL